MAFICLDGAFSQTVAVSRFKIQGGQNLKAFFKKINSEINHAKRKGAKYLLLPELAVLDLYPVRPMNVAKEIKEGAAQANSIEAFLETRAKEESITIIGASQYVKENEKIFNRAYVFGPRGKIGHQDKLYPTPWEKKREIAPKDEKKIKLFKTRDFSFVILICHDAEFPDISHRLAKLKPEVIFVPYQADSLMGRNRVAFTAQARSIEHMSYTLAGGATSVKGAKWHTYQGGASLFRPQNKYFPLGGETKAGSGLPAIFSLDLKKLRSSRSDQDQVYPAREI